jgi:hypothetical protein
MEQARQRLVQEYRASHLRAQADAWQQAEELRRYCNAAEATYGDRSDTTEWLNWARAFASELDPLTEPPTMPALGEVGPEDLQPYLPDGWSAHAPDARDPRHAPAYRFRS